MFLGWNRGNTRLVRAGYQPPELLNRQTHLAPSSLLLGFLVFGDFERAYSYMSWDLSVVHRKGRS